MSFAHVRRGQICKQGVVGSSPIVSTSLIRGNVGTKSSCLDPIEHLSNIRMCCAGCAVPDVQCREHAQGVTLLRVRLIRVASNELQRWRLGAGGGASRRSGARCAGRTHELEERPTISHSRTAENAPIESV